MYIYLTSGTYNYLKTIPEKYPSENIILMMNENNTLLLHETERKTIFSAPRIYEVLNSYGNLPTDDGYYVIDNYPTTSEGKLILEHNFKKMILRNSSLSSAIAIRVLSAKNSNSITIITAWTDKSAYLNWQSLSGKSRPSELLIAANDFKYVDTLFNDPAILTTYKVKTKDDE